jgi:hypothetical protein
MARCGDWQNITGRVRSGAPLGSEERAFVADVLDGNIKRKKQRPETFAVSARHFKIAFHVVFAEVLDICGCHPRGAV